MPGVSKKTPLPHWQKVMDHAGWLSATDISRTAHLPVSTVYAVIYGSKTPSDETILRIANAAKLPVEDIASDVFAYAMNNRLATISGITR